MSKKSNGSSNSSNWITQELSGQYQQLVAKDIVKNLYNLFHGTLYFSEEFLSKSSWVYENVNGEKQFEIDLVAKIGRNGHESKVPLKLAIEDDFFYSVSNQKEIIFKDNINSKENSESESHFIIYEITTNYKLFSEKMTQLETNIQHLIDTSVINDINDIFIAGVATKKKFNKRQIAPFLKTNPLLKELNNQGRLFFVFQQRGTIEQLPEMLDRVETVINSQVKMQQQLEEVKEEMRRNQEEMRKNQEEMRRNQEEMRRNQEETRKNQEEMLAQIFAMLNSLKTK